MLTLRDYQLDAVNNLRNSYAEGHKAPLFVLPTGGGKTVVFSYITSNTSARGKRALILVHRVELIRQTSAALEKNGVRHGMINPKFTPDPLAPIQVASVQTFVRRISKLRLDYDLIVIDEAHHATAGTWRTIIEAIPTAWILGVTATPIRGDGNGLGVEAGGIFDDLVIGPQVNDLISRGYLVKPIIYAPTEKLDLSGIKMRMGDYDAHELAEKMDKPSITGNAVEHYRRLADGLPAVAFCVSVSHAQHVADQFKAAGYRAAFVDGKMEDNERKRILSGLGSGSIQVVTSCDLISEGTDIPAIGVAILLRPTQSTGLYIQQVGRALRPCAGKDRAIILDHVGNVLRHGLPDEARDWTLDGLPRSKKNKKKPDELPLNVVQCKQCYAVHEKAPVCPQCGYVYELKVNGLKEIEGELKEITEQQALLLRRKKRQEVGKAKTIDELKKIEYERGYKPGWAHHVWRERGKKTQVSSKFEL